MVIEAYLIRKTGLAEAGGMLGSTSSRRWSVHARCHNRLPFVDDRERGERETGVTRKMVTDVWTDMVHAWRIICIVPCLLSPWCWCCCCWCDSSSNWWASLVHWFISVMFRFGFISLIRAMDEYVNITIHGAVKCKTYTDAAWRNSQYY